MSKLLTAYYDPAAAGKLLLPRAAFHPYPVCGEDNTLTQEKKTAMWRWWIWVQKWPMSNL